MARTIYDLQQQIRQLQGELEEKFKARREAFEYRVEKRRVVFEEEVSRRHKELRISFWRYVTGARLLIILTAPFIYAVIIPFVLLDLFVTIYQAVCFPVYGIKKVPRRDYIVFDRHQLAYLNGIEKFNCLYCSYGNGLVAWVREVASRTEQYWCPIKHSRRVKGIHQRYPEFADYGDADSYRDELKALRKKLRDEVEQPDA